jgi:hypothetical protein
MVSSPVPHLAVELYTPDDSPPLVAIWNYAGRHNTLSLCCG